jgi:hypothetical protein
VYVLNETTHPTGYTGGPFYYLVVDEAGVVMSKPEEGYADASSARAVGEAIYKQRKGNS